MVVDLDRCTGCGACSVACAVENNVAPGDPAVTERTSVSWLRVARVTDPADTRAAFVPLPCMQCGKKTPCVSVCPQKAVEVDAASGVVGQIPVRCLGCRYCMAACPYHARSFNWFDPVWPAEMKESLNPDVSTRTRGVVEKCNFCFHRLQAARAKAAAAGSRDVAPGDYVPACVEACPAGAIVFGDLGDPGS
jgi:molybdopterin-containing oxidoreductase family iron-sulfur binding subunit